MNEWRKRRDIVDEKECAYDGEAECCDACSEAQPFQSA